MLRLMIMTALLLSGCTFSTNPIFTEKDNVFDEAFLGTWETKKDGLFGYNKFEVTRGGAGAKNYRVILSGRAGAKEETFHLYLSQIDGTKFLTGEFGTPSFGKASTDELDVRTVYLTFAIDRLEDGELTTRLLAANWLARRLKENPGLLAHEWHDRPDDPEQKNLLVTASTTDLRAFVLSQRGKSGVWLPVTFNKIR